MMHQTRTAADSFGVELKNSDRSTRSRWENWLNQFSKTKRIPLIQKDLQQIEDVGVAVGHADD